MKSKFKCDKKKTTTPTYDLNVTWLCSGLYPQLLAVTSVPRQELEDFCQDGLSQGSLTPPEQQHYSSEISSQNLKQLCNKYWLLRTIITVLLIGTLTSCLHYLWQAKTSQSLRSFHSECLLSPLVCHASLIRPWSLRLSSGQRQIVLHPHRNLAVKK